MRTGLSLVEAVPKLKTPADAPLQVRVGIATGLVVVGDLIGFGASQEQTVVGETPNLAARLQTLAEPGAVVISSGTQKLIGGLFDYRGLGSVALKGFDQPVPVWQVLGISAAESRFEALRASSDAAGRSSRGDRRSVAGLGRGQARRGLCHPALGRGRYRQVAHRAGDHRWIVRRAAHAGPAILLAGITRIPRSIR